MQPARSNSARRSWLRHALLGFTTLILALTGSAAALAQSGYGFAAPGGYGLKIYRTDYSLYPFVQVYLRTFDSDMQPLINLNELNIGLMVKGRPYNPMKRQYGIQSIRQREEATRSVLVIDASKTMSGAPFEETLRAAIGYIESKRPQDEIAVLAVRDTKQGYQLVSQFERDERVLARRIADIQPDGMKTRLYDTIGAGMQMCAMSAQGSVVGGNYVVSCSLVVFSDGKDEGSSITRNELMTRISNLGVPIPIYSLAYSRIDPSHFQNLEALSKNSFGIYYLVGETTARMQRIVEEIQNILQSDYVVTFRSYIPVDGENHSLKLGVEYPSGSGKYVYDDTSFEAIQPPPIPAIRSAITKFEQAIPKLPAGQTPYWDDPTATPEAAPVMPQ
ncbi:von Willebrand factor A [Marichromatium purpuratum 984]|uniref:von Willebrand factor A n=1 Tax=Marichromatium purpuratum 984 TaxID=765910 RepID=W0E5J9_MARPU|nr:VWA domain-containing protein [Marichromatium purpuratum]AHF04808.1 von Willebrand factor A [Marichromatium purpuratum 984]